MFTLLRSRTIAAAALAIGIATAPFAADADTITYNGYTLTNSQGVSITSPITANVGAGRIVLDNVQLNGNNIADINAWCIDINNTLMGMGTYGLGTYNDPTIAAKLNALMTGAATLDLTTGNNSAAVQVAIWKTVVSNFTINTSVGNGSAINTLANTFISNVNNPLNSTWKASNTMQVVTLDPVPTNSTQRLVTLIPGSPNNNTTTVPEPASMALISIGLIGLGAARRLRARRTIH